MEHDRIAALARAAGERWRLTPRQVQVLEHVARGLSNRQIAENLGCTVSTVESHLTAILGHAGVSRRAALLAELLTLE